MEKQKSFLIAAMFLGYLVIWGVAIYSDRHPQQLATVDAARQTIEAKADTGRTESGAFYYEKPVIITQNFDELAFLLKSNTLKDTILRGQIEELKKLVDKQRGTIERIITQQTATTITAQTTPVFDTVLRQYQARFKDSIWYDVTVKVDSSAARLNASFLNVLSIAEFTKKRKTYVKVLNHNPYSITQDGTNLFEIKQNKTKRFGIGVNIGYGIGTDFKPKPYLGAGVSYNFLNF